MADEVLRKYIDQYGAPPSVPNHLLKFSRQRADLTTLNYSAARQAIANYQQRQTSSPPSSSKSSKKLKHSTSKPAKSRSPTPSPSSSPQSSKPSISISTSLSEEPLMSRARSVNATPPAASLTDSVTDHYDMDDRKDKSIVIDNGTSLLKIGYVSDKQPVAAFHPTQISNGRILKASPIERGIVKDIYKIEDTYKHAFRDILRLKDAQLKEYGVIMNCAVFCPRQTAEELCELMFETFGFEKFFISSAAVLSLYATQKVSGVVLESGGGLTQCVPIWKGTPVAQACKRLDVGGGDIDEYLYDLLKTKGVDNIDLKICQQIKEKYSYIATNYRKEKAKKIDFQLPDGRILKLGDERFKCGELLFSYLNINGIDKQIYSSIMSCDSDIRKQLFGNIVISGGCMMMKGIKKRLTNELIAQCKGSSVKKNQKYAKKINITVHKNRDILSWLGGSTFGGLEAFKDMWYTKEQYAENGSSLTTRIENSNIFFYDDYSPKEVDLKEIQEYNQQYRRRTISVYSHKNSVAVYTPDNVKQPATASGVYGGSGGGGSSAIPSSAYRPMNYSIKPKSMQQHSPLNALADDSEDDNDAFNFGDKKQKKSSHEVPKRRQSPQPPPRMPLAQSKKLVIKPKDNNNNDKDDHDESKKDKEAIQKLLAQIEDLQNKNDLLKMENETLKQLNSEYKQNEKKYEQEKLKMNTERLRLENLRNEMSMQSNTLFQEIQSVQKLFDRCNDRIQGLDIDFLTKQQRSRQSKVEPIND